MLKTIVYKMNLVNNYNDLSRVFNKYNVSTIDFKTKLTIDLPLVGYEDFKSITWLGFEYEKNW